MVEYYFDIETTGIDPVEDKVITIQWQRLDRLTWDSVEDLTIIKEWECSEEKIIKKILSRAYCENLWDFVFIGKNLMFDFNFLNERSKKYGLRGTNLRYLYDHPFLDLKHVLVLINNGNFKNYSSILYGKSNLNKIDVPNLYICERYHEILEYIEKEASIFIEALKLLRREMPLLQKLFLSL